MEYLMEERIVEATRLALRGSRQVRITFKKEAAKEMSYFLGMLRAGCISVSTADKYILATVALCHSWAEDNDRTVVVTLASNFDEDRFVRRMMYAVEKIEVLSD